CIAAEHGIDPTQVPGTGGGGRVTKKDIQAFIAAGGPAAAAPEAPAPPVEAPAPPPQAVPAPPPPPPPAPAAAPPPPPPPPPAPAGARPCAGPGRGRRRPGRDARADVGHAARHRGAHAALARHLGTRDERDRGRHVEGRVDPAEAEEGVRVRVRRQPDVPRLH